MQLSEEVEKREDEDVDSEENAEKTENKANSTVRAKRKKKKKNKVKENQAVKLVEEACRQNKTLSYFDNIVVTSDWLIIATCYFFYFTIYFLFLYFRIRLQLDLFTLLLNWKWVLLIFVFLFNIYISQQEDEIAATVRFIEQNGVGKQVVSLTAVNGVRSNECLGLTQKPVLSIEHR